MFRTLFAVVSFAAILDAEQARCDAFPEGRATGATSFESSSVEFRVDGVSAWVSIDGGRALSLPEVPFELDLAPGGHTVVLYTDAAGTIVLDRGMVTLDEGQSFPVLCTTSGCMGFDSMPVVMR